LILDDELDAAVACSIRVGDVPHERLSLSIAMGLESLRFDAVPDQPIANRFRPTLRELQVRFGLATIIGVPLDLEEAQARIAEEGIYDFAEEVSARFQDLRASEGEVDALPYQDLASTHLHGGFLRSRLKNNLHLRRFLGFYLDALLRKKMPFGIH